MRTIFYISLTTLLLICYSCSDNSKQNGNNPDVLIAKQFMEGKISTYLNNYFKVSSFNKVDGVKGNLNGVDTYRMLFTLDIVCVQEGSTISLYPDGRIGALSYSPLFNHPAKIGETYTVKGSIFFEKYESGWCIKEWEKED